MILCGDSNIAIALYGMVTVAEGIQLAKQHNVTSLIINKRHKNDEFGLVLLSDIAKQVIAKDRSPERVNLYEIMSKPLLSVSPDMDIRYCARLFENFGALDSGYVLLCLWRLYRDLCARSNS